MIQIKRAVLNHRSGAKIEVVEYKNQLTFKIVDQWGQKLVQDTNSFNELITDLGITTLNEFVHILRTEFNFSFVISEFVGGEYCLIRGPEI